MKIHRKMSSSKNQTLITSSKEYYEFARVGLIILRITSAKQSNLSLFRVNMALYFKINGGGHVVIFIDPWNLNKKRNRAGAIKTFNS